MQQIHHLQMNHLKLVVHCVCLLGIVAEDTAAPESGYSMSETPFSDSSGSDSGSGDGDFLDILPSSCDDEYRKQPGHTMCLRDNPGVVKSGVSSQDILDIVSFHNEVRASVEPPATDMPKMVWDDLLAAVAEKWAKQCIVDHDQNRNIPQYGVYIGQNVAGGTKNWSEAMHGWSNEVALYRYGQHLGDWRAIGHYTQMVYNETHRLGCGYAECREAVSFYVCNYARQQYSIRFPYTQGERCSKCPLSCKGGLCDCGGKLCLNGGILDINTCSCTCQGLYKGDNCSQEITTSFVSKFNCTYFGERPSADECKRYGDRGMDTYFCQSRGGQLTCGDCNRYSNVKTKYCPEMCAICPEVCDGKQCLNHGQLNPDTCQCTCREPFGGDICDIQITTSFVSKFNCTYFGERPSADECKRYGDRGMDTNFCQSRGGQLTCGYCNWYSNVKTDYCPEMCAICPEVCDGKQCLNHGQLNPDTCQCTCREPFGGDTCDIQVCDGKQCLNHGQLNPDTCQCKCREPFGGDICDILTCPENDKSFCEHLTSDDCLPGSNIPSDCPYLCDLCD